jgi:maleylacetoacetate isomerase
MPDFILYSYFRSSASYRARIGLALKGIAYDYRAVHLLNNGGEQRHEEYLALNPSGEVPTLVHKGRPLAQSMAILQYLDDVAPHEPLLFPRDPFQKALVTQACEIVNSGIQPLGNLKVLGELERRFGLDAAGKAAWTAHWVENGMRALESFLTMTASDFCFGGEPCAADAFLVPQVAIAIRHGISLEPYPLIAKINKSCLDLEPFRRARPEAQPDTPPEIRA